MILKKKIKNFTYLGGGSKKTRRRLINFQSFKPYKVEFFFFLEEKKTYKVEEDKKDK